MADTGGRGGRVFTRAAEELVKGKRLFGSNLEPRIITVAMTTVTFLDPVCPRTPKNRVLSLSLIFFFK